MKSADVFSTAVENTSADFKLYQKTDAGQNEITDTESAVHKAAFSIVSQGIGGTLKVDFSAVFTFTTSELINGNIVIMYPAEGAPKLGFGGTNNGSGTINFTRIAIYDASRVADGDDTPYCADFVPSSPNQFTGSSMV